MQPSRAHATFFRAKTTAELVVSRPFYLRSVRDSGKTGVYAGFQRVKFPFFFFVESDSNRESMEVGGQFYFSSYSGEISYSFVQ